MLRDLTIKNYRSFKDFSVDGLAQVNLLVGKNNSGKTSLLEAIYLLVRQNDIQTLLDIMDLRGEIYDYPKSTLIRDPAQQVDYGYQFRYLFHGYMLYPKKVPDRISLESKSDHNSSLTIDYVFYDSISHSQRDDADFRLSYEGIETEPAKFMLAIGYSDENGLAVPAREDGIISSQAFQSLRLYNPDLFTTNVSGRFLTTEKVDTQTLSSLWDAITLTPKEDDVIAALKVINPDIERVNFTSSRSADGGIRLKLHDQQFPLPIGSMGDGIRRLLSLAIALVTSEDAVLLVDEIDTGLHYQAQTDMWRLVIETAKRLNVQVFATTHSWDCVCAFQEALAQTEDPSVGKLLRLSQRGEDIQAVAYTAEELAIAVQQGIEVR